MLQSVSFETWLVLGLFGFYVYDCAMLLDANTLIFAQSFNRWSVHLPSTRWRIGQKLLFFSNLLLPNRLLLSASWLGDDDAAANNDDEATLQQLSAALKPLAILSLSLMLCMLVILPVVIFKLGTGAPCLALFLCIYLNVFAMLGVAYKNKITLQLSKKTFTSLALDALACPPFAINMVRKISLQQRLCKAPLSFAAHHLPPAAFAALVAALQQKVNEALECTAENSQYSEALNNYRKKLLGIMP